MKSKNGFFLKSSLTNRYAAWEIYTEADIWPNIKSALSGCLLAANSAGAALGAGTRYVNAVCMLGCSGGA